MKPINASFAAAAVLALSACGIDTRDTRGGIQQGPSGSTGVPSGPGIPAGTGTIYGTSLFRQAEPFGATCVSYDSLTCKNIGREFVACANSYDVNIYGVNDQKAACTRPTGLNFICASPNDVSGTCVAPVECYDIYYGTWYRAGWPQSQTPIPNSPQERELSVVSYCYNQSYGL
ncbi:MAG: hypothetical protein WDO70_03375 [Alphaproteobacteria bacterium]